MRLSLIWYVLWSMTSTLTPNSTRSVPPNTTGFEYTSPTIILPDGNAVMDSRKIATFLEERHPEPGLRLDAPQLARLEKLMPEIMAPARPIYLAAVPRVLLNEASHEHWYRSREKSVGLPLDQLEKEKGGPIAWKNAEPAIKQATSLLNETEGPFFMGEQVSYADFVWAGYLIFLKRMGDQHFAAFLDTSGDAEAHLALLEAVKPWAERDDH